MEQCRTLLTFYMRPATERAHHNTGPPQRHPSRRRLAVRTWQCSVPNPVKRLVGPAPTNEVPREMTGSGRARHALRAMVRPPLLRVQPQSGTALRAKLWESLICLSVVCFAVRRGRRSILTGYHSIAVTDICDPSAQALMSALIILFLRTSKSHRIARSKKNGGYIHPLDAVLDWSLGVFSICVAVHCGPLTWVTNREVSELVVSASRFCLKRRRQNQPTWRGEDYDLFVVIVCLFSLWTLHK